MMGKVLRIEKTSIHDGEGMRTVVFLLGCPLQCKWCSTPESQNSVCQNLYGKEMSTEEIVDEVSKDEIFFFHSNGGLTLSGGEVLQQPGFCMEILKECRYRGIRTAIETSFYGKYDYIQRLLPFLDELYLDIKVMDRKKHKSYTGVYNDLILDNIRKLQKESWHGNIHIRIPCIPTVNMDEENIKDTALFCKDIPRVVDIELLFYHRLGLDTYRKLNLEYALKDIKTPDAEELKAVAALLHKILPQMTIKIKGELYHP